MKTSILFLLSYIFYNSYNITNETNEIAVELKEIKNIVNKGATEKTQREMRDLLKRSVKKGSFSRLRTSLCLASLIGNFIQYKFNKIVKENPKAELDSQTLKDIYYDTAKTFMSHVFNIVEQMNLKQKQKCKSDV